MTKKRQVYCRYQPHPYLCNRKQVVINKNDLQWILERAGLYLHTPDLGTGIVVIHDRKER